jgi:hypothetical protein
MFGDGLHFPPPYRNALFVLDWTYGRVLAVHLATRAGYVQARNFPPNRPLNVTDVATGPDGTCTSLPAAARRRRSTAWRLQAL